MAGSPEGIDHTQPIRHSPIMRMAKAPVPSRRFGPSERGDTPKRGEGMRGKRRGLSDLSGWAYDIWPIG